MNEPHRSGYSVAATLISIVYCIAAFAMLAYGLHRLWLTWRLFRDRRSLAPARRFTELPMVTVQLPMFNERHVAERLIDAVCALDYPRDRLQIQVLDDSNDDSVNLVRAKCERMAAAGHPISHLHRAARDGWKSGALAAGLKTASGELIVIFDADFVPDPDFLHQTIHHFTDPKVGVVQAAWSHLNRSESWLTELQAMFLDGHFVVEQTVRSRSGRWFNFNGTAGVWRKSCIAEAGGWQHDTLTEDTDLSYRAQLAGWRFVYLANVRCAAELPSTMTAFLGQQQRWTKGLIQTARKLLPRIVLSRAPWRIKAEAWFHLTSPFLYLLMFLVSAIALPAMFLATPFTDHAAVALVGLAALSVGTLGAATFYVTSQRVPGRPLVPTLLRLPFLMALGVGICAVNARAVVEALLGVRSPFVRTPKRGDGEPDPVTARLPRGLLELLLAGVLAASFALSFRQPFTLIGAPFLLLFVVGYAGVGVLRLLEPFALRVPRLRFAAGAAGAAVLASAAIATLQLAPTPPRPTPYVRAVPFAVELTGASWTNEGGAIRQLRAEPDAWALGIDLNEETTEGSLVLDVRALDGLFQGTGQGVLLDAPERQLVFEVELPAGFSGELQAFVKDARGGSEYGGMNIASGEYGIVQATLIPSLLTPAMGYQDQGFDPATGITAVGLKISAQSDQVRGVGYRPFKGTIRLVGVGLADVPAAPAPEVRDADHAPRALPILAADAFLSGSGVDRPWPFGYAFAGPVTPAIVDELERTYAAIAAQGGRFTRVYVGDYRAGLIFDYPGHLIGIAPAFLDYLDQLAAIANRHGITVMVSLTDNAMVNMSSGLQARRLAFVREGDASDAFIEHALVPIITTLKGRKVIWDVFNEPENVTSVPLLEIQGYVDRVLAAGRRADPRARFTVVSRSRPEITYWRGRGLDLYSHNIFTERALAEALAAPRTLEAPIMVAEMAPALVTRSNVEALRAAGYSGVGIWGWGTLDRYQWPEAELEHVTQPLRAGFFDDIDVAGGHPCQN